MKYSIVLCLALIACNPPPAARLVKITKIEHIIRTDGEKFICYYYIDNGIEYYYTSKIDIGAKPDESVWYAPVDNGSLGYSWILAKSTWETGQPEKNNK